jgi:hypothetical protein
MNDSSSFTKLVPGFDFLQGLVKNAGAALPGIGQWVAPTIDPAEIEKRIEELRTVQFWLEQNARMLGATIQALEVQRMTLSTLKTMNVQMEGLRDSLKIRVPEPASPEPASPEPAPAAPAAAPAAGASPDPAKAGVVDPMQWWGALTKQFGQLATAAMTEGVAVATPSKASKPSAPTAATAPAAKKVAAKKKKPARRKVAAKAAPRP